MPTDAPEKWELFKAYNKRDVEVEMNIQKKLSRLTYEFDAGIWSSLVQEVVVKAKDDIWFIFKNGFEVRV